MKERSLIQPNPRSGFTIVEMLVVAPVVILAIGAFLTVIISMTGEVISSRAANNLTFAVQDGLSKIEQDIKLSAGFLATNSVTLDGADGQGVSNDGTNFVNSGGDTATALILNMVATTGNPNDASSTYVFLRNQPNSCANADNNIPMTYNVVYFVQDETLWRRVIMPQNYADTSTYACADAWQRPSCNPEWLAEQVGPTFCTTEDEKILEGINAADFSVDYFINGASDTPIANADNAAALIPATTARVSLAVEQLAGGRDVAADGSIRSTRLDLNASAIASLTPVTIPAAPTIASTTIAGARAVFTWPAVTGATGYTIEYNINGGGTWTTGFTNQNTRSYTVTAPANEDVVNARVVAINSSGTSGQGTTAVTIPLWEPLILQNGWKHYGSTYSVPAYTKTKDGVVLVKGLINKAGGSVGSNEVGATLPEGYRPAASLMFGTSSSGNSTGARIGMMSNGDITMRRNVSIGWVSLEMIRFIPDGRYTRVTPTLLNGYTNFGSGWAPASYVQDDSDRVATQGMVNIGTTADNTVIFNMPSSLRPSEYLHNTTTSETYGAIGVRPNNGIVKKAMGSNYLSLNTIYYPGSVTGWSNLSLQNSWTRYSTSYSSAQYKKSDNDNIVMLKGLLRRSSAASSGQVITTLPVGFRPVERILYTVYSNNGWGRADILPNGQVRFQNGSNVTFALDGIVFSGADSGELTIPFDRIIPPRGPRSDLWVVVVRT